MSLHLVKLCVGIESVKELRKRQIWQYKTYKRRAHITRMTPKRSEELLKGGSLYWVIKGLICVRQSLKKIEPYLDDDGKRYCRLHLDKKLILVRPTPRRAFQGWRYLPVADAPPDIIGGLDDDNIPEEMRTELANLGLL
ncbi:MAG: DUF1489 domain-containing protein [Alphaproteobacteria bacterium]|nr:DUF1489 domain-containing protein [Alphaproteobacteria bacterium]MBE8220434.1 DUF1489 domain-containing protein [Alphaproteobacteria bacterium]